MKINSLIEGYQRLIQRAKTLTYHLTDKQLMIILAIVVGTLAGFATYIFEFLLHYIKSLLVSWFPQAKSNMLFLVYPVVGIMIVTLFVKRIIKDNISEGVTRVLYAISKKGSHIKSHNMWSSVVASSTTLGFGGSVGPEAPIVLTGAAIGSNVGRMAKLNYKNTTLLLCCGAGAAVSAIFKAPITGVLFVLEILMLDITVGSVIPLIIATATGAIWAFFMRGFDPLLAVSLSPADVFKMSQIPLYITLGVLCGLMGYYLTYMNEYVAEKFKQLDSQLKKWLAGGIIIGLLIFIFPPLYGEGYESIMALMRGNPTELFSNSLFYDFQHIDWVILIYIVATMLFKVIAMASTTAAGGIGGTFAPSLFIGSFCGASLALACNIIFGMELSIVSFTLVGMAGVMSGVMNAPLTSIFLIAELSGGYGLFIPLMIVASIAFAINTYLEPESIYTKPLSKAGELLTHNKDQSALVFLNLAELMESDFHPVMPQQTLGNLVQLISTAKRNIFPVINEERKLLGIVQLDDLREDMFTVDKYTFKITHYMTTPPDRILENEQVQSVLKKFDQTQSWMLPVVDKNGGYIGFISKSRILTAYREQLINISQ